MSSNIIGTVTDALFGDKRANSETRHRPKWWPNRFDKRWLGERFAIMSIPPYKPPHRRHICFKAWVCMGPNYAISANVIAELDLDERTIDIDFYR